MSLRIIAGTLGGRIISTPHGHRTHPMGERARGGLFNTLGDIQGLSILDAFAGSGAIGFEAISRGARRVTLIDKDKNAFMTMQANQQELELQAETKITQAGITAWLKNNPSVEFDIVVADPPYDDLQHHVLERLAVPVKRGGLLVLSWPGDLKLPVFSDLEIVSQKSYGDIQLAFYRKTG